LFYVATDRNLMTVPIKFSPICEPGLPKRLISVSVPGIADQHSYAVSSDGRRFLVVTRTGEEDAPPVTVVVNWQSALKK
jgi:hypothetical protein